MEELITKKTIQKPQTFQILKGAQVLDKIEEQEFLSDWEALYENCKWATAFQRPGFATEWYKVYHHQYAPVLVYKYDDKGLAGILALAIDGKKLIGAGESISEYQVWLARNSESSFISTALLGLQKKFPTKELHLKYLPPHTPVELFAEGAFASTSFLKTVDQPVQAVDGEYADEELKKKNKKEKIRRLKRLGELSFERVDSYEEFEKIFDELAIQSDFRKGAMFDAVFFQEDPLRKKFLLSLFKHDLLHTTVLKVDEEIIASNVGVMGRGWVHLQGINTHSPTLAKHSPGILHFLMLGQKLSEEGFHSFDLTPGADGYKQSLATGNNVAYELRVFPSVKGKKAADTKESLHQYFKGKLMKMGIDNYGLRDFRKKRSIWKQKAKLALKNKTIFNPFKKEEALSLYEFIGDKSKLANSKKVNLNSLRDLLLYQSGKSLVTRWEFLDEAMRRLEVGQNCLTIVENGRLQACVWLRFDEQKKAVDSYFPGLPKKSLLLEKFYFAIAENDERNFQMLLNSAIELNSDREKYFVALIKKRRVDSSLFQNID
ncbi:GNAT family N-acetyltransferase [Litoribacter ruber]|uniref:GNAT family N-acetyltransferase n=1 Tax=Litoribacter ruber TaxID=702568 RepID=UPI001BD92C9A|nr:GNAT family N-acetyltransferase [Litoribacter ruber]MBT0809945.1 GNAT family N-acetyltransferase [Litoribacter ruber]